MELKIVKAIYYNPNIGSENGTDVTAELSAEIREEVLFYNGTYNRIFPDHFKGTYKKLKIVGHYGGKPFTKFYNENEKINLPNDLGNTKKRWWERTWVQILVIVGSVASIISLYFVLK